EVVGGWRARVTGYAPAGTDVVVVDDGSPGACASQAAAEYGARAVRLPRRRGFCAAANAGVAAATGAVVELLNDDAEATDGWADAALACFADPAVGAGGARGACWPARGQRRRRLLPRRGGGQARQGRAAGGGIPAPAGGVRGERVERVLPARGAAAGGGLPGVVRGLLRGRGPGVPPAAGGLPGAIRAGV